MPLPVNNVTRIEDLPDLSDIENSFGKGGMGDASGMGAPDNNVSNKYIRKLSRDNYQNTPYQNNNYIVEQPKVYDFSPQEMFEAPSQSPTQAPQFTCLDVCNHIKNCPLCSKFYNNDNSLYIIIIVALLILTIILTKKVLNL
jgi:hypothetical protein